MANKVMDGRSTVSKAIKSDLYATLRDALAKPQGKSKKSFTQEYVGIMLKEAKDNPSGPIGQLIAKQLMTDDIISKLDAETDRYLARDKEFLRFRIMNTLYKEQRDVFLDKYRKKILIGSRRIGKTELAARLLLEDMIEPNHHAIFISMKFENGIRQCYNIVLDLAKSLGFDIERESKSDGEILFTNGSNILFKGNSNKSEADKLLGYKYSRVIIDEAQNQIGLMYLIDTVLAPAMTDYEDSSILLIGTPPRIPHTAVETIWKTYHEWHHYSWDMRKNPYLHNVDEYIAGICRDKGITEDAPFIQREMRGQWAYDTEAQVFKDYKTYETPPKGFKANNIIIGNDYGFVDYNAIIGVACDDKSKKAYVYYEKKFNKSTVSDIIAYNKEAVDLGRELLMANPDADINRIAIYGDTSDESIIKEMRVNYKLPAYKCYKHDKAMAISQLAELMRKGDILIPKDGVLADEAEMTVYERDEEDNITAEISETYHPDALMALLYASRQIMYNWSIEHGHRPTEAIELEPGFSYQEPIDVRDYKIRTEDGREAYKLPDEDGFVVQEFTEELSNN